MSRLPEQPLRHPPYPKPPPPLPPGEPRIRHIERHDIDLVGDVRSNDGGPAIQNRLLAALRSTDAALRVLAEVERGGTPSPSISQNSHDSPPSEIQRDCLGILRES